MLWSHKEVFVYKLKFPISNVRSAKLPYFYRKLTRISSRFLRVNLEVSERKVAQYLGGENTCNKQLQALTSRVRTKFFSSIFF